MATDGDGLKTEIIEGIEVYRIDDEAIYTGACDEVDAVDEYAVQRRKDSGWWGDQSKNNSDRLSADDLKKTLYVKSLCPNLESPGVYMYVNTQANRKVYIGSAISQTILKRQQQHLYSASCMEGHVGKFDAILSRYFSAKIWEFYASSMKGSSPQQILDKERELILQYRSFLDEFGYNTQLPGGRY